MVVEKNNLPSLLYNSLKDIMYNKNTIYIFCNFNIKNIDNILNEMLDIEILDCDGIRKQFSSLDWTNIENYFMFNTSERLKTIEFIKDNIIEQNPDKKFKIFLDIKYDNRYDEELFISLEDLYFNIEPNISNNITIILE